MWITAGSAVNICITGRGNKNSTSVNSSPAAAEMRSARLATRQMESTSFLPQYWLHSTMAPPATPNMATV